MMQRYANNCKECANYNKLQMTNRELEKHAERLDVLERGEDARAVHNEYLAAVKKAQEDERRKKEETRAYYEESIALEKEAKEKRKLQLKAELLEEQLTSQTQ